MGPNQSHFFSATSGRLAARRARRWMLGKYADQSLSASQACRPVNRWNLAKGVFEDKVVVPNIAPAGGNDPFIKYQYQTTQGRGRQEQPVKTLRYKLTQFEADSSRRDSSCGIRR